MTNLKETSQNFKKKCQILAKFLRYLEKLRCTIIDMEFNKQSVKNDLQLNIITFQRLSYNLNFMEGG